MSLSQEEKSLIINLVNSNKMLCNTIEDLINSNNSDDNNYKAKSNNKNTGFSEAARPVTVINNDTGEVNKFSSINKASSAFGVPRTTLRDGLNRNNGVYALNGIIFKCDTKKKPNPFKNNKDILLP